MIVITIVQYVLINKIIYNQQNVKLAERIKFNIANQEDIEKTISEDLQKRLSLLYTAKDEGSDHKLKYNDWIEYTIKSPYVYVNKENDIKYTDTLTTEILIYNNKLNNKNTLILDTCNICMDEKIKKCLLLNCFAHYLCIDCYVHLYNNCPYCRI